MLKHCIQTKRKSSGSEETGIEDGMSVASSDTYSRGNVNTACSLNDSISSDGDGANDIENKQKLHGLKPKLRQSSSSNLSLTRNARTSIKLESIQEETNDINDIKEANMDNSIRKSILFASFIFAFVACITFGIGHYFIGYFPESVKLNEGDTKLVAYSTYFCSAVYTETPNVWLTVLRSVSFSKQLIYERNSQLKIDAGKTWSRNFYLTKNSRLNITIRSLDIVDLMVFMGEKKMRIWSERKESETFLYKYICCLNVPGMQKSSYSFNVDVENNYYVVIHRSKAHGNAAAVNLTLKFKRPNFDFTKTNRQCKTTESKACSVPLDFATQEKTIIERPLEYKEKKIHNAADIEWKCTARIWFYFLSYGCVYILLILLIFIVYKLTSPRCIKACKSMKNNGHQKAIYTVKYNNNDGRYSEISEIVNGSTSKQQSICKSRLSDSVSYESIAKYHNFALDDDDDHDSIHKGINGYQDGSCHGNYINKQSPTGVAAIYREGSGNEQGHGSIITKYVAPKLHIIDSTGKQSDIGKDNEESLLDNSEEILLNWPQDITKTSEKKSFHHALLKPTRSTGYFRVLSPMTQSRTGSVEGRRELRSPKPIFYRPSSQTSMNAEKTGSGDAIEI